MPGLCSVSVSSPFLAQTHDLKQLPRIFFLNLIHNFHELQALRELAGLPWGAIIRPFESIEWLAHPKTVRILFSFQRRNETLFNHLTKSGIAFSRGSRAVSGLLRIHQPILRLREEEVALCHLSHIEPGTSNLQMPSSSRLVLFRLVLSLLFSYVQAFIVSHVIG